MAPICARHLVFETAIFNRIVRNTFVVRSSTTAQAHKEKSRTQWLQRQGRSTLEKNVCIRVQN